MKIRSLFFSVMTLTVLTLFIACDDDDTNTYTIYVPDGATTFILNEGSYGNNNSNITAFNTSDTTATTNFYSRANGEKLGDTGNDIIFFRDASDVGSLYVVVNVSKRVLRLDPSTGIKQAEVSTADQPRSIAGYGDYVYVSCYGGKVLKLDASTLEKVDSIIFDDGDTNLEGLAVLGSKLYVANAYTSSYTYNENLYVINLSTFEESGSVPCPVNPKTVKAVGGKLFVLGLGNYGDIGSQIGLVSTSGGAFTKIADATAFDGAGTMIYFSNSSTSDWVTYTTTFGYYNTADGTLTTPVEYNNLPAEVSASDVYLMAVDPYQNVLYIGTSDFLTNGTIYVVYGGNYVTQFDAGGINPGHAAFLDEGYYSQKEVEY